MTRIVDIEGYDGKYTISDDGVVMRGDKVLKLTDSKNAHVVNLLSADGGEVHFVHRLVAKHFIGSIDGRWVKHINGNRYDNRSENLELLVGRTRMSTPVKTCEECGRTGMVAKFRGRILCNECLSPDNETADERIWRFSHSISTLAQAQNGSLE